MKQCEFCGAMLDTGEICDCQKATAEAEVIETEVIEVDELKLEVIPFEPVKEIQFNKTELEQRLKEYLKKYDNLVITKDLVSDMKKEKAELNKLKKALNDEKIRQKKIFSAPITVFEDDVKGLLSLIDNSIKNIDVQTNAFDEQEKNEKISKLKAYFDENIGELKEKVTFESIFKDCWKNKSESLTACQNDIKSKIFIITKELDVLKKSCTEFYLDCELKYFESYNLIEALELETALRKRKEAFEAEKAREEESVLKQAESPDLKSEEVQEDTTSNPQEEFLNMIKPEEKRFKVIFEVDETIEALNDLKASMDIKKLRYRVIK